MRRLVSYSVRIINVSIDDIHEMKLVGQNLFKACSLFDSRVSPSLWCFTQATQGDAKDLFNKLRLGLGCNKMESREQKHQIDRYSKNSLYQEWWKFVFRHRYIQLIYLPENNFDKLKYWKRLSQYIPNVGTGQSRNCFLKRDFLLCLLCDSEVYKEIVANVED